MNDNYQGCISIKDLTYERLREKLIAIAADNDLSEQDVNVVSARTLKPVESIGNPERKDFPLVKGREVMVDNLARHYTIRVTDLDPENLGREKYGVMIEHADRTRDAIEWSDVVFATGSTLVNNTYRSVIRDRPLVFYGVTVSGISHLTGCPQYCHKGH
jgi:hypothetical protein